MKKTLKLTTLLLFSLLPFSCQDNNKSDLLVTDVNHTVAKRQSIGNCWLYAHATWMESLYKTAHQEDLNVSESYWTWWHWYEQILGSDESLETIQTGGHWYTSTRIIYYHGWLKEGEFLPEEAELEMSAAQAKAETYINTALAEGGELYKKEDRTAENIRKALDKAFGSDMEAVETMARERLSTTTIASGSDLSKTEPLINTLLSWRVNVFPKTNPNGTQLEEQQPQTDALLKRVMKALNDRQPVLMSVMVDFNALDVPADGGDGIFRYSTAKEKGMGRQGGHMVVLEDYTVENVPGIGNLGEGDLTDEEKVQALLGKLSTLKAKNSWGSNRPARGLIDGHTSFDYDYLTLPLPWKQEGNDDEGNPLPDKEHQALSDFILPPGY